METFIKVANEKWSAEIWQTEGDPGFYHIQANINGKMKKSVLDGAYWVLDMFAQNRMAWIRAKPEAASETDFDTKIERHRGYVRFTFRFEKGEWEYINSKIVPLNFGEAQ